MKSMKTACLQALKTVLGEPKTFMPLHEPLFTGNEWQYVKSCLDSGWVSSVGEYVSLFEKKLAEYTGASYAIAVVNGTAALHVCLILAEVQPNDEVLLPALTFVATANAVAYCHAIPHFVEADEENLGIDLKKLRTYLENNTEIRNHQCFNKKTGRRIKAIIPVHIFGHPVDMQVINHLAKDFCLTVIEDAAESLGSYQHDRHTGTLGEVGCLSFNGNKIITTGGGGAILTNNEAWAKKAKHLTTTGKRPHQWEFYHDEMAYNYRLPNINAALGCAQLEKITELVDKKRQLAKKYQETFANIEGVSILAERPGTKSNYWLNALILEKPNREFIQEFIEEALIAQYGLRGLWTPLDRLPMYQHCPKMDLSVTDRLFDSVISLPSSPHCENKYA